MQSALRVGRKWAEEKLKIRSSSLFLCIALFVNRLGAMTKMIFPLYLVNAVGYTVGEATALMATYGFGLFIGSFVLGVMADHFPTKRIAVFAFVASAAFLAILGQLTDRTMLAIVLSSAGLADSGANVLGQRLLLDTADESERPQVQALVRVSFNLGAAFAGILCGALALLDFKAVFLFDAICSLGAAWIIGRGTAAVVKHAAPVMAPSDTRATGTPFLDPPFLLFETGVLLVAVAYHTLYFALGNYIVQTYGGSTSDLGTQFTINAALIVLAQVKLTTSLRDCDSRLVITAGTGLLAAGFGLLFMAGSFSTLIASTIIWTFGEMMLFPMISMEVMRRAEHRRSGQYFGLAAAAWNSAALIAPVAIAAIATITGLRYVWLGSALACVVAAVFMTAAVRMFNGGAHRA